MVLDLLLGGSSLSMPNALDASWRHQTIKLASQCSREAQNSMLYIGTDD